MKKTLWLSGVIAVLSVLPACGGEELSGMEPQGDGVEPAAENLAQTSSALAVTDATWFLPYRGGYGGGNYDLDCPAGYVATGVFGRAGKYIDRMGLTCKQLNSDGSLGGTYNTPSVGGGGGGDFSLGCTDGEAIVGLGGASGGYVDRLGLICAKPMDWLTASNPHYTTQAGGGGGGAFDDRCPAAHVVTSILVNAGGLVDGVRARCNRIN
ncbi:hypothetical protein ACLESO_49805 [Pyxidicoccus sp. 3LG]